MPDTAAAAAALSFRCLLFAPALDPHKLERAWASPAGAVIADLEDAVVEAEKDRARDVLAGQLERPRARGRVVARINALDTPHAEADLAMVRAAPCVDAVLVPKACAETLGQADTGGLPLLALVETAAGVLDAPAIARVPGVVGLMAGTIDLAAELGLDLTAEGTELRHVRGGIVLASAAAGLPGPIDGVWNDIEDVDGLVTETRQSRRLGFTAKACIHPAQIAPILAALSPTAGELAAAARLVRAAEAAFAEGRGAFRLDDRMIDRPVVERARRLLAAAGEGGAQQ
jgi:citrate lyase subunit beta / citryl-CoA lyase